MTTSSSTTSSPPAPSPSGDGAVRLDLSGEVCPYTFVRTRLALESLPLGGELIVTVDHPPAARNVPRSAADWGQEVVAVAEMGSGHWSIHLRKRVM